MFCQVCEKVTDFNTGGVCTCEPCKKRLEEERTKFYRDVTYPIDYSSILLYPHLVNPSFRRR
jgi:hypothetical protein